MQILLHILAAAVVILTSGPAWAQRPTHSMILLNTVVENEAGEPIRIVVGRTPPQNTNWDRYGDNITLTVDTSDAGFSRTPLYFTSLGGAGSHYTTTGATSIYEAERDSFKIYVQAPEDDSLETAIRADWHINWIAIGPADDPTYLSDRELEARVSALEAELRREQALVRRLMRDLRRPGPPPR